MWEQIGGGRVQGRRRVPCWENWTHLQLPRAEDVCISASFGFRACTVCDGALLRRLRGECRCRRWGQDTTLFPNLLSLRHDAHFLPRPCWPAPLNNSHRRYYLQNARQFSPRNRNTNSPGCCVGCSALLCPRRSASHTLHYTTRFRRFCLLFAHVDRRCSFPVFPVLSGLCRMCI